MLLAGYGDSLFPVKKQYSSIEFCDSTPKDTLVIHELFISGIFYSISTDNTLSKCKIRKQKCRCENYINYKAV